MTVKVWAVHEFQQEAKAAAERDFAGDGQTQAQNWLDAIALLTDKAHNRGDGVAVYVNQDLGHRDLGQWQIVSYGSTASQLETRDVPEGARRGGLPFTHENDTLPMTLPDFGQAINWRYQLEAIVPAPKPCTAVEGCVYREGHDVEVFPHRVDPDEARRARRTARDINWALIAGAGVHEGDNAAVPPVRTGRISTAPPNEKPIPQSDDDGATYKIVRFYRDDRPKEVIETGLSLDAAQEHCKDESTHGEGWFDGYEEE